LLAAVLACGNPDNHSTQGMVTRMKKNIFIFFVLSVMTGFLINCTLPPANAESNENDHGQKIVVCTAELSNPEQLTEIPPSTPKDNIDHVEISIAQIIEKAEQGDIYSQYDLALMYFDGKDVPQNIDKASSWLLEAANRGHLRAQQYVATLYESGKLGFPKDKDKAEYWSSLRGRPASSTTGNQGQVNGSKKGISFSGFTIFAVLIVFALIAVAFVINKKKIKTTEAPKTVTLDFLESHSDSEPVSDITLDDLSEP